MELLLILLFALGVFLLFAGMARRQSEPARIDVVMGMYRPTPQSLQEEELAQPFSERILKPFLRGMAGMLGRFTAQRNIEAMRHKLDLAGNPYNWTVADLLGFRVLIGICAAAVLGALFFALRAQALVIVGFIAVGAILGFYIPLLWLTLKIRARQSEIQKTLPDALDLLTISVEAGLGFDAAMAKVSEQWDNEIGHAFGRVLAEIRVGKLRTEALRDMALRMDVPDMTSFVAAVVQTDQLGVPISKVLRIQSEQMRIKRRQHAEEKANKAPIRMLFPLAFLIFPAIYIVLLGPVVLRFLGRGFTP
jgi:tight adherence protein C